jgi:hypothetical protein
MQYEKTMIQEHNIEKPRIYISSTVYDFRDLRTALKYWLEQLGYEVQLSDFNDFTKPLDTNTYDACLRSVQQSNYFILLVGSRVGGFYNKAEKVTITRMEYRTAYEMVRQGKMKLVAFVRNDLWAVREDRKALRKFLIEEYSEKKELDEKGIDAITYHSSSIANDAEVIFDFLKEIGRIDEMKKAMAGQGEFPVANWIHQFSTFEDVIMALKVEFSFGHDLRTIALIANLKQELLSNLSALALKTKEGKIHFLADSGIAARRAIKGDYDDESILQSQHLRWLAIYALLRDRGNLSTQLLDQALVSGQFLEFDTGANVYKIGLIHQSLFALQENIARRRLFSKATIEDILNSFITKYTPKNNPKMKMDNTPISISNSELIAPLSCLDVELNIIDLCIALFKAIDGDNGRLVTLKLRPSSPIESMAEQLAEENPTITEMNSWIASLSR